MNKRKLKILDAFIIGRYLGTFVYTLAVFVVVIIVFDLSEKFDDFLGSKLSIWQIISQYYFGSIPFYVNMLSPLINFIAVIFFTAKMANQTEIVPILSGGVSFNRFLRPYFISASIIFAATLLSNLFLLPDTNKIYNKFINEVVLKNSPFEKKNIHMKIDKDTYIYMDNFDNRTNIGYRFSLDKFKGDDLKKKLMADQISFDSVKKVWKLSNFSVRYINGLKERMIYAESKNKDTALDMRPSDFSVYDNVYQTMSVKELSENIKKERIRGSGVMNDLLFEQYRRWTEPLSAFILTLIGVALSSRKVRGGVGLPLGIGIILSFMYIVLSRFAQMFSLKGGLPPILATLVPAVIFGAVGLYLLKKAPK